MTVRFDYFWFWYGSHFNVVSGLSYFTKGHSGNCFNTMEEFVPKSVVFSSLSNLFFSYTVTFASNDVMLNLWIKAIVVSACLSLLHLGCTQ